jgi:hypothetical protein
MAIVINGSGTITGVSPGGLPDGSVDSDTLATGIDATKLADGTVTSTELQYINSLSSNAQTQISGAGGAWSQFTSGTTSSTTSSVISGITKESIIYIYAFVATNNNQFKIQLSSDGGSSWKTTHNWRRASFYESDTEFTFLGSTSNSNPEFFGNDLSTTAAEVSSIEIRLSNFADSGNYSIAYVTVSGFAQTDGTGVSLGFIAYETAETLNAIRITGPSHGLKYVGVELN